MRTQRRQRDERGHILLVIVFIATAIAGLAAITSGRVVSETKQQRVMEDETKAFKSAYAQLHVAMNVVNTSAYNDQNQNLILRNAVTGLYGGTIKDTVDAGTELGGDLTEDLTQATDEISYGMKNGYETVSEAKKSLTDWLDDEDDPKYGFVQSTGVRVYRGREYLKRLQRLKGEKISDVDPFGDSDSYFVLEAAGRSGDTIRLVSALVRESEPFSSFVFFQNRATLGVSGAPRGLIHANDKVDFYFPNGNYVDPVSAVNGFGFEAGATEANTNIRDGNPEAAPIALEKANFEELKTEADLYVGEAGLDAEIRMYGDGKIKIKPHTAPRYDKVEKSYTYKKYMGTEEVTVVESKKVKVGEKEVPYEKKVKVGEDVETYYVWEDVQVGETTETYYEWIDVQVGETTETKYKDKKVQTGTKDVKKTKEEPVYEEQTVTKYKKVKTWVPYNDGDAGGGTSVGGGAAGEAGEWVWVDEPYETTEMVQVGTKTVEYWVTKPVYEWIKEPYTVTVPVYEKQQVEKTKQVPIYESQQVEKTKVTPIYAMQTFYKTENVYEWQDVEVTKDVPVYEDVTVTYWEWEFQGPVYMSDKTYQLGEGKSGTVYVDGRITRLQGDLQGRLTVVGNEKVRITDSIRYVDEDGDTAMLHGDDYTRSYERNAEYKGKSVLGVIARDDVVFTSNMPSNAEVNGTLMSVNGRVGIDGFWSDSDGELHKDSSSARQAYLTYDQQLKEAAYDNVWAYRTRRFRKDSLRRIGGLVSNNRVMETFIKAGSDGYAKVDAGFKRGVMRYDINLLFNPPPNFVEVPRPVATAFVPIVFVRNNDA